jgi:hypothetical protein
MYSLIRHASKPRLRSWNVGLWRRDYVRVNGFDETYAGWGCEDDDFGVRLRRLGLRLLPIYRWTRCYHLWHPTDPSVPKKWRDGVNVAYLQRRTRLTCCRNGLRKRRPEEVRFQLVGRPEPAQSLSCPLPQGLPVAENSETPAEVEILFLPGKGRFSGRADCNVVVLLRESPEILRLARDADVVVGNCAPSGARGQRHFRLDQLEEALRSVA